MRILLVYPYFLEERIHTEEIAAVPMGLYSVGATLQAAGHDVRIVNWHAHNGRMEAIERLLVETRPELLGFSIVHANRWGAIDIARRARVLDPGVKIVFGGIGATFLWEHLLTHFPEIDFIVAGEGEVTLRELVRAITSGSAWEKEFGLPGLALRRDGKPVMTAAATPIRDLDALPQPGRYYDFQHLSLTRGCPGRCTFCGSPAFWGRRVRAHSAEYFVDQIERLACRGNHFFFFSDDTFTLKAGLVIEVCKKIIQRGLKITWQAISRVNAVSSEMLVWMRNAGCIQISYGIESGSPKIRGALCKDIDQGQIEKAFDLTIAHGILARAYFIYGAPGETFDTIQETLDLIRRIKPLSVIFYLMTLFPGTALYEDFKRRTGARDDIWLQRIEDIFYFQSDPGLDRETVLAFGRRLRETYFSWLPEFALQVRFNEEQTPNSAQADFLSRLALTFSHGDYAWLKTRPAPGTVARSLFERALSIHPDHRAFWGLGMLLQGSGEWGKAGEVFTQGLKYHTQSRDLSIGLAICHLRQGRPREALELLQSHENASETWPYLAQCYTELGDPARAARYSVRPPDSKP